MQNEPFFELQHQDELTSARNTRISFARPDGNIQVDTPAFMPVGTAATVKAMWPEELEDIGYRLILANTYHLKLRPGEDLIAKMGGVKKFMGWDGALLTDSGGFQAFSLGDKVAYKPDGIEFSSHIDGARHKFTPRGVVDIQRKLGSDIMMVLDDCAPGGADQNRMTEALDRTHRWALDSLNYYHELIDAGSLNPVQQKLFGIIQGGSQPEARRESAQFVQELPFPGIAVGGLSVGESRESFYSTLEVLSHELDPNRPRYLMGVGTIPDFLEAVRYGIDIFDCVLPTRNARNGQFLTSKGKINVRNAVYADKDLPPDENCSCKVCRKYSLSYLRHLFLSREMLGAQMATFHNLHFFYHFMAEMRTAIRANRFTDFYEQWKKIPF